MKILLFLTFYLISGSVGGFDVIGSPGGSLVIHCKNQQYGQSKKYFCREKPNKCIFEEKQNSWVHEDRVSLFGTSGVLTVSYKDLSLEDAGLYQCGENGVWSHAMNLTVKTDSSGTGPKTVIGYLGETVTITCSYPEEFQTNIKTIYKKQTGPIFTTVIETSDSQKDRFSISDNGRVISVRISDLKEDDGGIYYCGVGKGGGDSVSYTAFFKKIQLQIKAPGSSFSIIIISVSICVALLLIGGLTLIFYKRRCSRTEGSASPPNAVTMGNINEDSHPNSDSEKIRSSTPNSDPRSSSKSCSNPLVYATVNFQKNPGSSTDARINVSKEEPDTEYATIKHPSC